LDEISGTRAKYKKDQDLITFIIPQGMSPSGLDLAYELI